ncbi:hypothetical protein DKP78_25200, partial [Enterococcus faecium]
HKSVFLCGIRGMPCFVGEVECDVTVGSDGFKIKLFYREDKYKLEEACYNKVGVTRIQRAKNRTSCLRKQQPISFR